MIFLKNFFSIVGYFFAYFYNNMLDKEIVCYYIVYMINEKIITQCAYCGQFQKEDGSYDGIKREIIRTGNISHGICPEDFKKAMEEIKNL